MKRTIVTLALAIITFPVIAAETFTFSFDNVAGSVPGTVEGTIELNFLTSGHDSGIGPASEIRITSAPGTIPASSQGPIVTAWTVQVQNRFEVVNGVIVDYEFGAAVGPESRNENAFCLNNGPGFLFPSGVWGCGQGENYYGDASLQVYNADGIGAVTFRHAPPAPSAVPTLSQWSLMLLALLLGMVAIARIRRQV